MATSILRAMAINEHEWRIHVGRAGFNRCDHLQHEGRGDVPGLQVDDAEKRLTAVIGEHPEITVMRQDDASLTVCMTEHFGVVSAAHPFLEH
jgi:hypothetical protein